MCDLRYVFSAPAMIRVNKSSWEDENPEDWIKVRSMITEGIQRLQGDIKHRIEGTTFGMDILFNAYTEKDMGERIATLDKFGFEKLYADSGGLQIVTAGKTVDDSLKASIYQTQSVADYAMCFDEIPVRNIEGVAVDSKSNRSQTGNKHYLPELKHASATKTAENIREQIEVLDKFGTPTTVHYIVQGNTHDDMLEWFADGAKVLTPDHYKKVGGLALADTCMGNGPMESIDMLVAYNRIRGEFGEEYTKNHVHLLGLGSVKRLLPVFYMMNSGLLPKNMTISFDSTTFSMSYFMGRFLDSSGHKIEKGEHAYRKMFHEVWKYFGDIYTKYAPECDEQEFVDHVVKEIRSLADSINNSHDRIAPVVRANITLTICWQILGFIKNVEHALNHAKYDRSPLGLIQDVTSFEEYQQWQAKHGHKVRSMRIKRKFNNTIDDWFDD